MLQEQLEEKDNEIGRLKHELQQKSPPKEEDKIDSMSETKDGTENAAAVEAVQ